MVASHVFVESLDALDLTDTDAHHLRRVLRLRAGEVVTASDGRGAWRRCRWREEGLEADGPVTVDPVPAPAITIGFALVKGDRPEWIVQKLTELGIDTIVPMSTERCVVRWDQERAGKHLDRLRAVAREAAMQSRRTWLPEVADVTPFGACLGSRFRGIHATGSRDTAGPGAATGEGVALSEAGGGPPTLATPTVLVGPEGGWSEAERAAATSTVSLGPHVLRAETAAVTAGGLLAALRGGVVRPVPIVPTERG